MKILATNTIRAGRFATMNDPREAKRWMFDGPESFGEDPRAFWRMQHVASVAATWIQSNLRVVAFSLDDFTRRGADPESPLGRGFGHPAMWAHYGARHTGACLIFDRAKLEQCVRDYVQTAMRKRPNDRLACWSGAVIYEDRTTDGTVDDTGEFTFDPNNGVAWFEDAALHAASHAHACKHYERLVLRKGIDWSYENEYRWVFWDEGQDDVSIDFGDALVGIVVGEDFGRSNELGAVAIPLYMSTLKKYCSQIKVKAYRMRWFNGYVHMDSFSVKHGTFKTQLFEEPFNDER